MRHATAPGTDDPPGFQLDDCATQRLLSDRGRAEARATGAALREAGLAFAPLWSSRWCRCLETAALLNLGPVEPLPALDSVFAGRSDRAAQTAGVLRRLGALPPGARPFLVTHQVNIAALTGVSTCSGEIVVARRDASGLVVIARIPPAAA